MTALILWEIVPKGTLHLLEQRKTCLQAVQELHAEGRDMFGIPRCVECDQSYPCTTIQLVKGTT